MKLSEENKEWLNCACMDLQEYEPNERWVFERPVVKEKLLEMQQRIQELGKYNLDLSSESYSKSLKIDELEKEKYEFIEAWNSKLEKLTAENAELKAHVEYLVDVVDEVSTATNANMLPQEVLDLAASAIASVPEQSLAQHDKKVIEKAVVDFCCYLMDNGEPVPEEKLMVFGSDFLEQLQEQE